MLEGFVALFIFCLKDQLHDGYSVWIYIYSVNGDEVSRGENLGDPGCGDDFLEATLKA